MVVHQMHRLVRSRRAVSTVNPHLDRKSPPRTEARSSRPKAPVVLAAFGTADQRPTSKTTTSAETAVAYLPASRKCDQKARESAAWRRHIRVFARPPRCRCLRALAFSPGVVAVELWTADVALGEKGRYHARRPNGGGLGPAAVRAAALAAAAARRSGRRDGCAVGVVVAVGPAAVVYSSG